MALYELLTAFAIVILILVILWFLINYVFVDVIVGLAICIIVPHIAENRRAGTKRTCTC